MSRGLKVGGRALWRAITADHVLDATQEVTLLEACRVKDRLDALDQVLRANVDTWAALVHDPRAGCYVLRIDSTLAEANATATLLKQLLASLRLPGSDGKRPQRRGGARGVYAKSHGFWSPT